MTFYFLGCKISMCSTFFKQFKILIRAALGSCGARGRSLSPILSSTLRKPTHTVTPSPLPSHVGHIFSNAIADSAGQMIEALVSQTKNCKRANFLCHPADFSLNERLLRANRSYLKL